MEALFSRFQRLLSDTNTDFLRYLHDKIIWTDRMIAIVGARGVGKTTMMLQRIKLHHNISDTLYVTADDMYSPITNCLTWRSSLWKWVVSICLSTKFTDMPTGRRNWNSFTIIFLIFKWCSLGLRCLIFIEAPTIYRAVFSFTHFMECRFVSIWICATTFNCNHSRLMMCCITTWRLMVWIILGGIQRLSQ